MTTQALKHSASVATLAVLSLLATPAHSQTAPDPVASTTKQQTDAVPPAEADIIVTGSRLRAGFDSPTPVTALGQEQIETRAPTSIANIVNELPQVRNTVGQTANTRNQVGPAGTNTVDLRGLGDIRTLVLVDGRRLPSNRDGGAPDTNAVPSLLVERVDVVTGGASAAYGSNAIAGVVQFVLKRRVDGLQLTAQAGVSERGDNASRFFGAAWGTDLTDRIHLMIGGEYADEEGVGTALTRSWGRREVGLLSLPATRAAGLPAQLFADNVRYNTMAPGSLVTSGPLRGIAFLPGGQTTRFDFGTLSGGNQMTGSASNFGTSLNAYQNIKIPVERGVVLGRITADLGSGTEAWAEFGYNRLTVRGVSGFSYFREGNIRINIDNPYLPSSVRDQMVASGLTQITVGRSNDEIGPAKGENVTNEYRTALGLRGKIGGNWDWDMFAQWAHVDYLYNAVDLVLPANYNAAIYAVRDGSGNIVCGPLATNPNLSAAQIPQVQAGCVPFNPFGLGSPSAAALDYVKGDEVLSNSTNLYQAAVNVTGTLFNLPAGPVAVALGGEIRREDTKVGQSPFSGLFNVGNLRGYSGDTTVKEGYLEATVPLLESLPLLHRLEVNGALRYADYSSFGGSTTWKVGGVWEPFDGLRFRVTRSRDLRAPTLGDLFKPGFISTAQLRNPATGVTGTVNQQTTNNPNLGPEIGNTFTAGAVLTPSRWIPGLSISVDYFNIRIDNVIATFGGQLVLNQCFINNVQQFCDLVTRDPNTPTGISLVRQTPVNAGTQKMRGLDMNLAYNTSLAGIGVGGRLTLNAYGSYIDRFTISNPATPLQQNLFYTVPQFRYNVRAQYSNDRFSTYLQLTGFSSTRYNQLAVGPEDPGYNPASAQSISSNRFPAYRYLNAGFTVFAGAARKYQLFMTVDNLLDRDPPGNVFFNGANVYDMIGRTYKLGVRLKI